MEEEEVELEDGTLDKGAQVEDNRRWSTRRAGRAPGTPFSWVTCDKTKVAALPWSRDQDDGSRCILGLALQGPSQTTEIDADRQACFFSRFVAKLFLTYRTDTKTEMEYIRNNFSRIVNKAIEMSRLDKYQLVCYTDAEFVIYDDNRALDLPWFPIDKNFVPMEYKSRINELLTSSKYVILVTSNKHKYREFKEISSALDSDVCFHKSHLDMGEFSHSDLKNDVEIG